MPVQQAYFHNTLLALNAELTNHPSLLQELHPDMSFEEKFSVICTYCDVMVDGAYSPDDLVKLASILINKLKDIGSVILLDKPVQLEIPFEDSEIDIETRL